jgi:hypothetical protein
MVSAPKASLFERIFPWENFPMVSPNNVSFTYFSKIYATNAGDHITPATIRTLQWMQKNSLQEHHENTRKHNLQ